MSTLHVAAALAQLEQYLRDRVGPQFADVTSAEFPFCDELPCLHVNASGTSDDTLSAGIGFRERKVSVRLYVTVNRGQVRERAVLWDLADAVRDAVLADPLLGGLTRMPVLKVPVSSVPSPTGSAYLDCRQLSFDIILREQVQ